MDKRLTFGSLFSGIGGMDLGLERAGFQVEWQVEIDDYAQKVLTRHWPNVARFRDVRDCGAHNLKSVDLIAGGFPCQDISFAGKGAGLQGARSGLWYEFARIICEIRPRYILVENVAALLHRGMGDVLATLASFGYDAEWQVLSASKFGAPHLRERCFIIAYPCGTVQGNRRLCQYKEIEKHDWQRLDFSERIRNNDGISNRMDKLRGLGNAVVPQVAEYIGGQIVKWDSTHNLS